VEDAEETEKEKRDNVYVIPEFVFMIETEDGVKSQKSPVLDVEDFIEITLKDDHGNLMPNEKYEVYNIKNEKIAEGNLDENGYAKVSKLGFNVVDVKFPDLIEEGEFSI
ncbi:MAG: hypothetical protein FWG20_06290, partial [Candidatus Cloacimonetes bacterium]|nr:hypothetical protein [Candidatus Cloacimonadota bacterium]